MTSNTEEPARLPFYRKIVLLGIGHTNAHVLKQWRTNPIPDTELICISNHSVATYSGMLPAVLAGQRPHSAMEIDLVRLCSAANATLLLDEVTHLDYAERILSLKEHAPLLFDALSIGIGSVPTAAGVGSELDHVVAIKPMQTFLSRLSAACFSVSESTVTPLHTVVVGGGTAGVEISMCLRSYLATRSQGLQSKISLVNRGHQLVPGSSVSARSMIEKKLRSLDVEVFLNRDVTGFAGNQLLFSDGQREKVDLVIWATGAAPPPLLSSLKLPLNERGFLVTDETLKVQVDSPIFAVGDTGTIQSQQLPKAGVFAVRQGPVLWENLQRTFNQKPLKKYHPQRSFLRLLNCGDGDGIAEWHGLAFQGAWVLRLKNRIDSKFVKQYQV